MVEGQLQGAIVHAVKQIGYNNVKEIQFEVIQKVITGNKNVFTWFVIPVPSPKFLLIFLRLFVRFTPHPMQTTVCSAIFNIMCTRVKVLINIPAELIRWLSVTWPYYSWHL